ncbi:MAG TPA: hypothetical protein VLJ68_14425, partial [Chitinophagaceae bacterium]|nr:hypothetical protein [Chitinophagaceae bacterium]
LHAIRILRPAEVFANTVRGQYTGGEVNHKKQVAYRQENDVNPVSPVETFAAIKFHIDNWRWRDTPFFIRTGKSLQEKSTLITVQFKDAPVYSFPHKAAKSWRPNRVVFRIQPEMDIRLRFQAKKPGPEMELDPVNMIFNYADTYNGKDPEAYETLLEDVITGNQTLFMRADQVEAAWKLITPILEHWQEYLPDDFPDYAPGSWGPEAADDLIERDGRHWVNISPGHQK